MSTTATPEKLQFQTEAKQLLHLVVHSLYSHKEIFVRELISNASDALDRLRFEAVTRPDILGDDTELAIHIKLDKNAKTLTISDNGTGMSRAEVIENIGTIARSGTKAFLEKLTGDQKADANLIGQFGVGFYSAFMVASSVKVVTKRAGTNEPAVQWESDGATDYTLQETEKVGRGTEITVYLKDGEDRFTEDWEIRSLIKKYSDFIAFPIILPDSKGKDEIVNQTKPLWKRPAVEVTAEQYKDFFNQVAGGIGDPLATIHTRAEGATEYSALLFVPERPGFDLFEPQRKHGIRLYVKRVFIMDDCKELMPEYLRFVKGVVDSEDLPLNVSREMLQHNPVIEKIRKSIVGKILGKLKEIAENEPEQYRTFWKRFGPVIKEGVPSDLDNKEKLLELVRFSSSMTKDKDELTSLKQYVSRMREDQKEIYYITGESRDIVEKSPHLEVFREKSIEVLYMLDPIDEWVVNAIHAYEGKRLVSATKGELDLGDLGKEEKKKKKEAESELKKFTERIKNILAERVKDVRVTTRLKDSPTCLVSDEHDMGVHMEKIMAAMGQEVASSKRIFEINPDHPIIQNLNRVYEKDPKDVQLEQWVLLLYEQAQIAEGQVLKDPKAYTRRVNELLLKVSGGR